ncbi:MULTISPECIES: helix-turn-helix transcriptional regulator [Flammeovirga]|uniref:Helix-turn-helix transcriptional regulator n=1 Tax=Flammeovirga agarivorans TaxID=2726742 RepID=A0A7X8XV90_9BACT|nr:MULTISPECIES: AraC family transcriptional regulator [Flammeovirga]NLR90994.1 helix-turn-helix transcriptional regulator [Flammeovirga agarivorans]
MSKLELTHVMESWTKLFNGKLEGHKMTFNNEIGKGEIEGFKLNDSIELIRFDYKLNKTLDVDGYQLDDYAEYIPILFGDPFTTSVEVTCNVKQSKKKYKLNTTGAFSINSSEALSFTIEEGRTVQYLSVRLEKDYYQKFIDQSKALAESLDLEKQFFVFEEFDPSMRDFFQKAFEVEKGSLFENEYLEIYAKHLVTVFFSNINDREKIDESNKYTFSVEPVFKARDILKNRINEQIIIDELSKECGLSESRLRFLFKQIFGTTIHQFHLDERLDHSRVMLRDGSKTMSMIAMDLGFSSASHFSSAFKKKFNLSPKQYRKDFINSVLQSA